MRHCVHFGEPLRPLLLFPPFSSLYAPHSLPFADPHVRYRCSHLRVAIRPLNDRELADKQSSVVRCQDRDKQVVVQPKGSKVPTKTFYFDSVFGPERTQRELFQSSILPIRAWSTFLRSFARCEFPIPFSDLLVVCFPSRVCLK